ncbi:threonine/serine exporter family protein [Anaerosalibacter bizertensis]|uniref:Threonine/serine exporter family protein n=1 Tax=Anaerosalibacter bizertensis TaxID=932217 RepID=A0A9Q4AAI9_9FIRM|nr:threonine/serine exporter family protein [Anaerosalibacter bizertensis]MBV1817458.1 threonine/serine exporter family protein [Bacteroidales bacterium MSK.15.36]HHV27754.1 threonine/serine exporter [Tissierellia bacterium]MBU5293388.1 threonine/serine exporter family protein [Anaerosalibacter bizertensis]MCB5559242.1 threonine/serine exporter family protein [Anaerosalibacter bizertensis]MCG4564030.1 threonine/serine exporter family protein [Anaerosalibacter bizertensis]
MEFIKQFVFSFFGTIGASILFSIPRDSIIISGTVGSLGWMTYTFILSKYSSPVAGTFFGALAVGIIGELLARHLKKPATVFIIPGIIPLVPGAGMYYTMLALIEKRFLDAANIGTETLFIAVAISIGIVISSSLSRSIKRVQKKAQ